jgi:hypothetical protein
MDKQHILVKLNSARANVAGVPTLVLSDKVLKQIQLWTRMAADDFNYEISGMGAIRRKSYGYLVSEVCLIKPERANQGVVDMDPAAIYRVYADLYAKNKNIKHWRFLWHSHVRMNTFFSGTDDHTARYVFCPDAEWTFNLVTNVYGKMYARMDFPATQEEPVENLPVKLLVPFSKPTQTKWEAEYQREFASVVRQGKEEVAFDDLIDDPVSTMSDANPRPVQRPVVAAPPPLGGRLMLPPKIYKDPLGDPGRFTQRFV